jgi:hypothetical protein
LVKATEAALVTKASASTHLAAVAAAQAPLVVILVHQQPTHLVAMVAMASNRQSTARLHSVQVVAVAVQIMAQALSQEVAVQAALAAAVTAQVGMSLALLPQPTQAGAVGVVAVEPHWELLAALALSSFATPSAWLRIYLSLLRQQVERKRQLAATNTTRSHRLER